MKRKSRLKEFYNYKYWREIQRNQLGISANLYFVFSSAIFGFSLNFLLRDNKSKIDNIEKCLLILSLVFLLASLICFVCFTENRLKDFRNTAKYIDKGFNYKKIKKLTESYGKSSWILYYKQRCFLILGFIFSLIGFSFYIF